MLKIPPSKSHTMRALLFSLMAHGRSTIRNYLPSPDTSCMIQAIRALGARVEQHEDVLYVEGTGGRLQKPSSAIECGNSGQVLRFIAAIGALTSHPISFQGDHSVAKLRLTQPLVDGLHQLGCKTTSSPLTVQGPLRAGLAAFSGLDSQPVSALLMACSFLQSPTELFITDPHEQPWIDLTLYWLEKFGAKVHHRNYTNYRIEGGLSLEGFEVTIPADFSSAVFPLAASLISGYILPHANLDFDDPQGDKELFLLLQNGFEGGEVDVNRFIDGVPILAAFACYGKKPTKLINARPARFKESNRLEAMQIELQKMGADITCTQDSLIISPSKLHGANLYSHRDHRVAMSLAIAALGAEGSSVIDSIACVDKSFPDFVPTLQSLGHPLKLIPPDSLWIPGKNT